MTGGHSEEHNHDLPEGHGYTHGAVDPSVANSECGIWAVKWSFGALFVTVITLPTAEPAPPRQRSRVAFLIRAEAPASR